MNVFAVHLRKELRDQRATFLHLAVVMVVISVSAVCWMPAGQVANGLKWLLPGICAVAAAIGGVALAADVVPGEGARGTIALLVRLPQGLRWAFWGKVVAVVTATLGCAALTFAATVGAALARGPLEPAAVEAGAAFAFVPLVLGYGLWVLAFACWMPRGLPSIFVPLLLGVPHWLAYVAFGSLGSAAWPWLIGADLGWLLRSGALLAVPVAYASLVLGRRWSGGPASSFRSGGLALGMALLPALGTLGARAWTWVTPPPLEAALRRGNQWLSGDGRHAFFTLLGAKGWPSFACAMALDSGAVTMLGGPGSTVVPWTEGHSVFPRGAVQGDFAVVAEGESRTIVDGGTLARLGAEDGRMVERYRASLRERTDLRAAPDTPAWWLDYRFEGTKASGHTECYASVVGGHVRRAIGTGLSLAAPGSKSLIYDSHRARLIDATEHQPRDVWCLGESWLVRSRAGAWKLFDPDTKRESDVPAELARADVVHVFRDGRALVVLDAWREPAQHRLALASPALDRVQEVALPEGLALADIASLATASWEGSFDRRYDDLLLLVRDSRGTCATSYRPGADRLGRACRLTGGLVGRIDRDTVLACRDERSFERIDLRTGAAKTITTRYAP